MLQVATWSKILVVLILIGGTLLALPNALPENLRLSMPGWLQKTTNLGLDLQGGSSILLEVGLEQVQKDKLQNLLGDIRVSLNKARIGYTNLVSNQQETSVQIRDLSRRDEVKALLEKLNPVVGGSVLSAGSRDYDVSEPTPGRFVLKMTAAYQRQFKIDTVAQSLEAVRKRIDEMGTREPSIERQGDDRILVQVPGLKDPERLKSILGKTAKLTFQLVDETADPVLAEKGIVPVGTVLMDQTVRPGEAPLPKIAIQKRIMVAGDRLTDARQTFDQRTNEPVVSFRFDNAGARAFGDVTKLNVQRRFAIVLDDQVISAPVINEPILGGSGQISGNFTVESADDLAVLLRAGALPAPLKILEERTVGAELGADSIEAGRYAAIGGLILVAIFMWARYGLFGAFAVVALTFNVILLMAILTLFDATLTLPGIAGIVLTLGMAVDANVLIYERVREESRNGRSMISSLDAGFRRAMATIIDANMTHLIAGTILFQLGSGPVRGFAVTLIVGILTSFFTAIMVTRLQIILWLNMRKPKRLLI